MINNRQGGRRRGRGGQRPQGMTGGAGGNRQDNRQRGNAAQLLEKYKGLARDAQLSGDRVQTEYFLQFADHYFRVLSESRVRFEEQRRQRGEDGEGEDEESEDLVDAESEAEASERPQRRRGREGGREDRYERRERVERGNGRGNAEEEDERRIAADVLPPSIGSDGSDELETSGTGGADADSPKPRRRTRRPKSEPADGDGLPAV